MRAVLVLAGIVLQTPAAAVEIEEFDIGREGRVYTIQLTFVAAAPADEIVAVLTDFRNPDRLNPDVTRREILDRRDGVTRVLTESRSCLFLFCRDIAMVQDVSVTGGTITADIVPGPSDFDSGSMRWTVKRIDAGSSRVNYASTMEPAVFIPPLFGHAMVRRMLEREVLRSAERLEAEATLQTAP